MDLLTAFAAPSQHRASIRAGGLNLMKSGLWTELSAPAERRGWTVESGVRAIAGTIVLASVALAILVDQRWLWLTAFVGINLVQSAVTGWCLMSNLLALASGRANR